MAIVLAAAPSQNLFHSDELERAAPALVQGDSLQIDQIVNAWDQFKDGRNCSTFGPNDLVNFMKLIGPRLERAMERPGSEDIRHSAWRMFHEMQGELASRAAGDYTPFQQATALKFMADLKLYDGEIFESFSLDLASQKRLHPGDAVMSAFAICKIVAPSIACRDYVVQVSQEHANDITACGLAKVSMGLTVLGYRTDALALLINMNASDVRSMSPTQAFWLYHSHRLCGLEAPQALQDKFLCYEGKRAYTEERGRYKTLEAAKRLGLKVEPYAMLDGVRVALLVDTPEGRVAFIKRYPDHYANYDRSGWLLLFPSFEKLVVESHGIHPIGICAEEWCNGLNAEVLDSKVKKALRQQIAA